MSKQKFDAIIVGAGPAGSACGYSLAKAGLEALVVERGKYAGAKNMWGGAYYGPGLNQLFPNFWEEAPVERYIHRHRFSLLTPESILSTEFSTTKFAAPPYNGFSVLRAKFDCWMASKAEQAGAIVATGLQADDLLWDEKMITGVKAGGDELPADVVVACDGVNSILAEKAGLRDKLRSKDIKQGVKEVIKFPRDILEQRFFLRGEQGLAWEFIGTFTQGIPGGAFLYTNQDSLSIGIVVELDALAEKKLKANDLLEEFKNHPEIAPLLADGELVEYSAHLIPTAGKAMIPQLYADGFLVAGDAAGLVLASGLMLEGANFAIASGIAAAETIISAKKKQDFSKQGLSLYTELLKQSFVLKDLDTFQKAPQFLKNPRIYSQYPRLACDLAQKIYTNEGKPRQKAFKLMQESMAGEMNFWQLLKDFIRIKGAL